MVAGAKLGIVLVPINFMLNAEDVAFILGHADARHLIVEAALADVGQRALQLAGAPDGVSGWIGDDPTEGWARVSEWCDHGPAPR